jgi:hypothetical protein
LVNVYLFNEAPEQYKKLSTFDGGEVHIVVGTDENLCEYVASKITPEIYENFSIEGMFVFITAHD